MEQAVAIAVMVRDYLGIPPNLTFWELANSELIIAVATLTIGFVVNRRVTRIGEKVDDRSLEEDLEKELRERVAEPALQGSVLPPDIFSDFEAPPPPDMAPRAAQAQPDTAEESFEDFMVDSGDSGFSAPDSSFFGKQENFIAGADAITQLKAYVDEVSDSVSDGRKKRKYSNLGKRDYRVRILALQQDGKISNTVASALLDAFDVWRPYSTNMVPVPDDVIRQLEMTQASLADGNGNMRRHRRRRNV